jgi:hypothetical protein
LSAASLIDQIIAGTGVDQVRRAWFVVTFFLSAASGQAQDIGSVTTRIVLPGITFNLALNGAEEYALRGVALVYSTPSLSGAWFLRDKYSQTAP